MSACAFSLMTRPSLASRPDPPSAAAETGSRDARSRRDRPLACRPDKQPGREPCVWWHVQRGVYTPQAAWCAGAGMARTGSCRALHRRFGDQPRMRAAMQMPAAATDMTREIKCGLAREMGLRSPAWHDGCCTVRRAVRVRVRCLLVSSPLAGAQAASAGMQPCAMAAAAACAWCAF